jgi:hypothetical protein
MNYRRAFELFLMQAAPDISGYSVIKTKQAGAHSFVGVQEYVHNMYFEDPNGCVPAEYLGEDVMNDIHTKFYYPLAFLVGFFQKIHPELKKDSMLITIDPSYECATNYIMNLFEKKITLLQGSWNAWTFWFKDEADFENWVDDCLKEIEGCLQNKKE